MRKNWTDEAIATFAERLRNFLGVPLFIKLDFKLLILKFEHHSDPRKRITFTEMPAGYLRGFAAKARPQDRKVFYKFGLMDEAIKGNSSAIAVFIEEIAHCVLHQNVRTIDSAEGIDRRASLFYEFQEMEEEARKFVFYTFAPISEVYAVTDPNVLVKRFGMPIDLATQYVDHLEETRRRVEGRVVTSEKVVQYRLRRQQEKQLHSPSSFGLQVQSREWNHFPPSNANEATVAGNPCAGFLQEHCSHCGGRTMRVVGGCKHCLCGHTDGCDD
jgi:hypothetical protein